MKSNFELADELGVLAINTIKNVKLQNKILSNLKLMFDNKKYEALPPAYKLDLEELGMLRKWHYEAGEIIAQDVRDAIREAQSSGQTNKAIAAKLGVTTQQVTRLGK